MYCLSEEDTMAWKRSTELLNSSFAHEMKLSIHHSKSQMQPAKSKKTAKPKVLSKSRAADEFTALPLENFSTSDSDNTSDSFDEIENLKKKLKDELKSWKKV
jgi:hypothetical protein